MTESMDALTCDDCGDDRFFSVIIPEADRVVAADGLISLYVMECYRCGSAFVLYCSPDDFERVCLGPAEAQGGPFKES